MNAKVFTIIKRSITVRPLFLHQVAGINTDIISEDTRQKENLHKLVIWRVQLISSLPSKYSSSYSQNDYDRMVMMNDLSRTPI